MDTPEQDPTPTPAVAVGLSTVVGLAASAILTLVAALAAVLQGDHSQETIGGLVSAAIVLYGVIRSRGQQAAALTAGAKIAPLASDLVASPIAGTLRSSSSASLPEGEDPDPMDSEIDHREVDPEVTALLAEAGPYVYPGRELPPIPDAHDTEVAANLANVDGSLAKDVDPIPPATDDEDEV